MIETRKKREEEVVPYKDMMGYLERWNADSPSFFIYILCSFFSFSFTVWKCFFFLPGPVFPAGSHVSESHSPLSPHGPAKIIITILITMSGRWRNFLNFYLNFFFGSKMIKNYLFFFFFEKIWWFGLMGVVVYSKFIQNQILLFKQFSRENVYDVFIILALYFIFLVFCFPFCISSNWI